MMMEKGSTMGALAFLQAIPKGKRVASYEYKVLSSGKWFTVASVNKKNMAFTVETGIGYEKKALHHSEIDELRRLN